MSKLGVLSSLSVCDASTVQPRDVYLCTYVAMYSIYLQISFLLLSLAFRGGSSQIV